MQSTPRREISGGFSANRKFLPTLKKFRKYAPARRRNCKGTPRGKKKFIPWRKMPDMRHPAGKFPDPSLFPEKRASSLQYTKRRQMGRTLLKRFPEKGNFLSPPHIDL